MNILSPTFSAKGKPCQPVRKVATELKPRWVRGFSPLAAQAIPKPKVLIETSVCSATAMDGFFKADMAQELQDLAKQFPGVTIQVKTRFEAADKDDANPKVASRKRRKGREDFDTLSIAESLSTLLMQNKAFEAEQTPSKFGPVVVFDTRIKPEVGVDGFLKAPLITALKDLLKRHSNLLLRVSTVFELSGPKPDEVVAAASILEKKLTAAKLLTGTKIDLTC